MTIKKRCVSPRQKMINLMYVVLMAMLALTVSSEVLDAFPVVENSLKKTALHISKENASVYNDFDILLQNNPAKVRKWYDKAMQVRNESQQLYDLIADIKQQIAIQADGDIGNAESLMDKENLEAAALVMLSPGKGRGPYLLDAINSYCEKMMDMVTDSQRKKVIRETLSTDVPQSSDKKHWAEYYFESMPAAAAMAMLTKIQLDIRYTEGEVLHELKANIDANDVRVNAMEAMVIPKSQTVVRGNKFSANIVMAAVDTTQKPQIFIGGKSTELKNGLYEVTCNRTGDFTLSGWLVAKGRNGEDIRRDFSQKYSVVEPTAIVSSDLMNVLYAGYDNPISIFVPGSTLSQVTATMEGGTLTKTGDGTYLARPDRVGQTAVVTVSLMTMGREQQVARHDFRVRPLPQPAAYVTVRDDKDNNIRFRGGTLTRRQLLSAKGISAAVDDGILDIPFRVKSFETVFFDRMGNAVPMASDGSMFSARQMKTFQNLARNRRFYISRIIAVGPDNIERKLNASTEVIIR